MNLILSRPYGGFTSKAFICHSIPMVIGKIWIPRKFVLNWLPDEDNKITTPPSRDIKVSLPDWFVEKYEIRPQEVFSNCCGVSMSENDILAERCPDCKENCTVVTE